MRQLNLSQNRAWGNYNSPNYEKLLQLLDSATDNKRAAQEFKLLRNQHQFSSAYLIDSIENIDGQYRVKLVVFWSQRNQLKNRFEERTEVYYGKLFDRLSDQAQETATAICDWIETARDSGFPMIKKSLLNTRDAENWNSQSSVVLWP